MVVIWLGVLPLATWFAAPAVAVHVRKPPPDFCANGHARCCSPDWAKSSAIAHMVHPPRMVFAHGCSGSSQVMVMTKELMDIFHVGAVDCHGGYEVMADITNGYYNRTDMSETLRELVRRAGLKNQSLLFKGELAYARGRETSMKYLSSMNTLAAVVKRWNAIDTALCAVRDGFVHFTSKRFGLLVDDHWTPKDASFRGRNSSAASGIKPNVLVQVDTNVMLNNLHEITDYQDANEKFLSGHGYPMDFKHIYDTEDLFAYERVPGGLYTSAAAWTNYLWSLGVKAHYRDVVKYLTSKMGTHEPPKKHSELIINFDAVKKAVDECEIPGKLMQAHQYFRTADWCAKVRKMLRV